MKIKYVKVIFSFSSVWAWKDHKLKGLAFENRVLKRIFVPKRDEGLRGWRKLNNEESLNLHSAPHVITVIIPLCGCTK
jgi:hypothetical protein